MKRARPVTVGMKEFLFFVLAFGLAPVFAGSFYVATNGADTNAGTARSPWATIANAMRKAQPGTRFLFAAELTPRAKFGFNALMAWVGRTASM